MTNLRGADYRCQMSTYRPITVGMGRLFASQPSMTFDAPGFLPLRQNSDATWRGQAAHGLTHLTGLMTVVTDDWQEMVSGPGDFSVIRLGHDAWIDMTSRPW